MDDLTELIKRVARLEQENRLYKSVVVDLRRLMGNLTADEIRVQVVGDVMGRDLAQVVQKYAEPSQSEEVAEVREPKAPAQPSGGS